MSQKDDRENDFFQRRVVEDAMKAIKKHVGEDFEWGLNRIFLEIELMEILKNYTISKK